MRAPLTWQRSAMYTGMVTACMHSCCTANYDTVNHPHTMRTPLPVLTAICAASQMGRRLNGFILAIAVLAITSRLCIRVAVQNMNSTLQLALSLRVVLGVVHAVWLMH